MAYGPLAALDDRPRPGKEPTITPEAKAWLVSLACEKAKEHAYPHELWTTRLLARHARDNAPAAGHESLANLVQGTVCKILAQGEVKPHNVRYYATYPTSTAIDPHGPTGPYSWSKALDLPEMPSSACRDNREWAWCILSAA